MVCHTGAHSSFLLTGVWYGDDTEHHILIEGVRQGLNETLPLLPSSLKKST